MKLEEYILKRKTEDGINEFDREKRTENTRICVNCVFEYFNNYLETTKGEEKTIQKEAELERVRQARQRILRFNDEILFDKRHSKEHFDEILSDIDIYEDYCRTHEDYENNKAILAIATIREVYKDCLKTHDFLVHTKKVS